MNQQIRSTLSRNAGLMRAARALLGWTLVDTGQRAGISIAAVYAAEGKGAKRMPDSAFEALCRAYAQAGVSFVDEGGTIGIQRTELPMSVTLPSF